MNDRDLQGGYRELSSLHSTQDPVFLPAHVLGPSSQSTLTHFPGPRMPQAWVKSTLGIDGARAWRLSSQRQPSKKSPYLARKGVAKVLPPRLHVTTTRFPRQRMARAHVGSSLGQRSQKVKGKGKVEERNKY